MEIELKKKSKVNKTLLLILPVFLVLALGISYAFFTYTKTSDKSSQLITGDIYMHYNESNELTIENAIPSATYDENKYFEFTINGKNTYTEEDIWYEIVLSHGEKHATRTERIRDNLLKFTLVEIKDGNEKVVVNGKSYEDLTNQRIWVNTIPKTTNSEINITYRLYMWISDEILVGVGENIDYSMDTWNNLLYGSVRVSVNGDFEEKIIPKNFVNAVKEKYGNDSSLVAINTHGDLYSGTGEIREYRYSGAIANNYVFFDTNGDGIKDTNEIWRIVGIFKDTVKDIDGNVVEDTNGNPMYEEKIKIVRNTMLTVEELPENYLIKENSYKIADTETSNLVYFNSIKVEKNLNDWTKSGLQYYLNTENDESVSKNAGYLSFITPKSKELISLNTYYLGNVDDTGNLVNLSYEQERTSTRIYNGNMPTWNGLIGLLYPSDYGYSVSNKYWKTDMYGWNSSESDGIYARSTSWLYKTANHNNTSEWMMSPSSYISDYVMGWKDEGNVDFYGFVDRRTGGVRPTFYLESTTNVRDARGTEEDPFVIIIE